jgi:hypothetical protein
MTELSSIENRHPATKQIARWFAFDHLPVGLPREVSSACAAHARFMIDALPDGPELTAGLRKLIEAKDCFVRAAIEAGDVKAEPAEGAST